jgi:hypothetical protein
MSLPALSIKPPTVLSRYLFVMRERIYSRTDLLHDAAVEVIIDHSTLLHLMPRILRLSASGGLPAPSRLPPRPCRGTISLMQASVFPALGKKRLPFPFYKRGMFRSGHSFSFISKHKTYRVDFPHCARLIYNFWVIVVFFPCLSHSLLPPLGYV